MILKEEINKYKHIIDEKLNDLFSTEAGYQKTVFDSMKYSLFTGGKRLRPILLLKSCEMLKGDYSDAIPFALAIEMIHTYSLIHDDLPSMDNDDYRRGKLTNHKVYGESMAILAGDGLLNLAYEIVTNYILDNSKSKDDFEKYITAFNEICKSAGVYGMVGGQVVDIESETKDIDVNNLCFIYENKTAALIRASVVAGGIIGNGTRKEIESLEQYGLDIGLGYQIRDDILDVEEDKKINKITYLSFYDMEEAEKQVKKLSLDAIEALKNIEGKDTMFFELFAKYLIDRKK